MAARAGITPFLTFAGTVIIGVSTLAIHGMAQDAPIPHLTPGNERKAPASDNTSVTPALPQMVELTVPTGAPLQVALDQELQVRKVGQRVHGRVMEPVYAFDHIVVPAGSEVNGEVTKIETVSGGRRTLLALDANFSPERKVEVNFNELVLADGRWLPLHTSVTPGSGQVIDFVTAANEKEKKNILANTASEKTKEAKQQAHQQWDNAMKQLKTPGKIKRLERYGEAQLPVHHQYIPAGTVYFAELNRPLRFGTEVMTVPMASSIGSDLPAGSVVRARLVTPLSSATAKLGQEIEAVLSQPLMDGDRLILPQGSRLKGTVKQAEPARRMKKNGQLRIAFTEVVPPDGVEQKIVSTLEGVQAGKNANVKLDSEGGAEATTSKSRYAATAISLGLAMMSARSSQDHDGDGASHSGATGGLGGFKLVGMVVGAVAQSRAFGMGMGAYGAGVSVYTHFIARGREVEFPKNTAMQIGIGTRGAAPAAVEHSEVQPAKIPDGIAAAAN